MTYNKIKGDLYMTEWFVSKRVDVDSLRKDFPEATVTVMENDEQKLEALKRMLLNGGLSEEEADKRLREFVEEN